MKNKFLIALILAFMTSFASVDPALAAESEAASITVNVEGQTVVPENSGDDSPEDLFEQYMNAAFGLSGNRSMRKSRKSTGTRLEGNDLAVYQAVAEALPAIAAGDLDSTEFELTLDVFGVEKKEWTADELGVSSIVVEDAQGEYSFAQDAYAAANAKISFDLDKVLTALLADYPYELYWFDKKEGAKVSEYQLNGDNSSGEWKIILPESITLCFSVSADFSAGEYKVDTNIGQSVQAAVEHANAIIEQYSGASDEDKLSGYKDEICALTDYNDEAAGENYERGYGNPWQLLWVFDDDENTKVVCEGYSKAFKYLCDLSSFDDDITCILVTGTMSGGTGAGPHMWNIVKRGDGKNYLVDVTNCDGESVGAPDKLFLKREADLITENGIETGYTFHLEAGNITYTYDEDTLNYYRQDELSLGEICQHNLVNTPAKDATCTEAGNIEYWSCSRCGKRYSDAGGTTEITAEKTVIAANGHSWSGWTVTKKATSTENGSRERTCSVCGEKATETYALTEDEKAAEEEKQKQEKKAAEEQKKAQEAAVAQAEKEKADTAAANGAIKQINEEVPSVDNITLADKAGIDTAVKAYDALSADQKKFVPAATVKKLEDAKKLLAALEAEAAAEEKAGHKTVEATNKEMAALSDNSDPANSDYGTLALNVKKVSNKSIKLQWKTVKGAAGYIIYANMCGRVNKYQQVADVKGASKKSFTLDKIQSGSLKKNTYYKVIVAAYKVTKGGEQRVIGTSKSILAATAGGKNGNPVKLTLNKKNVTVKIKKTARLKAKQKAKAGTKIKKYKKLKFESSNPKIATVSKTGVIKGMKKGKCTVYVYAQNGLSAKVKVTVKK